MICLQEVKRYCKEYWKIENYQEAVNDTTQTWHCHHRHEIEYNLSKIELQALGFYFDRPSGDQWCVSRNYYNTYEEREREYNRIKVYTEKEARRK